MNAGLEVSDLVVRFGGNVAVNSVSLSAPSGRLTGLIGPNGAGKTTIFNACSGLLQPDGGRIELFGSDVTGLRPAVRARRGLGRSFQRLELCDALSVRENVALGLEARLAGDNPLRQLFCTPAQRLAIGSAADDAIQQCSLGALARSRVGDLPTGQRRLVELARCVAGGYRMLILDEPSSGLDTEETARFGEILQALVNERQIGILLVEHDMSLVMNVCEYLFVVDFGVLIFEGTSDAAKASVVVRSAYLGTEDGLIEAEEIAGVTDHAGH